MRDSESDEVERLLERDYSDRVYVVEDCVVWVSGMNAGCPSVANSMAKTLMTNDIPASLVYDDDAVAFGGVEFRYGRSA